MAGKVDWSPRDIGGHGGVSGFPSSPWNVLSKRFMEFDLNVNNAVWRTGSRREKWEDVYVSTSAVCADLHNLKHTLCNSFLVFPLLQSACLAATSS